MESERAPIAGDAGKRSDNKSDVGNTSFDTKSQSYLVNKEIRGQDSPVHLVAWTINLQPLNNGHFTKKKKPIAKHVQGHA